MPVLWWAKQLMFHQLLSLIRPILPNILHSPVAKRISMQIAEWEREGILLPLADTQHLLHLSSLPNDHPELDTSFSSSTDSGYTPFTISGSIPTGLTSPQSIETMIERPLDRESGDRGDWMERGGGGNGNRGDRGGIRTLTSTPTGMGRAKGPVPNQFGAGPAPGSLERRALSGGTIVPASGSGGGGGVRDASPRGSPVPRGE